MEITTNDDGTTRSTPPLWFQIVSAALVFAVYLCGLNVAFIGPDEPRYAQVAREMYQRGDWLTPTLGGHTWFEKPPLLYWFEIAFYHLFGVNEFAARLGPALCGLGIAAAMWVLGTSESKRSGALPALMTTATFGIIAFSHTAGFDVVLTLTLTWALVSFWKADSESAKDAPAKWLASFYVFTGLAVLAKGLIGLFFPFGIVLLFYIISRRMPRRRFVISLLWGFPLVLLVAAPWHVAMYLRHGREFIDIYFVQHHFERFTTNKYLHPQPFYFFWWVLPVLGLAWTPFAVIGLIKGLRKARERFSPLLVFALCWLAVPLAFFSFSGSKLPGYILPSVVPVVIIAWLWMRERSWKMAGLVSFATLAISLAAIVAYLPAFAARDSVKELIDTADSRGYATNKVLTLYLVSHSAEFYAAGRLRRDADGKQLPLQGAQEVLPEIASDGGRTVLVLIPNDAVAQFTDYKGVRTEVLKANHDFAIAAVSAD